MHIFLIRHPRPIHAGDRCYGRDDVVVDELIEIDFGRWEGRSWGAVPRDELDAWAADVWGHRPGGGESADMIAARWRRWCEGIRDRGLSIVIAVTHAGLIRVALACERLLGADEFAGKPIGFASVHACVR